MPWLASQASRASKSFLRSRNTAAATTSTDRFHYLPPGGWDGTDQARDARSNEYPVGRPGRDDDERKDSRYTIRSRPARMCGCAMDADHDSMASLGCPGEWHCHRPASSPSLSRPLRPMPSQDTQEKPSIRSWSIAQPQHSAGQIGWYNGCLCASRRLDRADRLGYSFDLASALDRSIPATRGDSGKFKSDRRCRRGRVSRSQEALRRSAKPDSRARGTLDGAPIKSMTMYPSSIR